MAGEPTQDAVETSPIPRREFNAPPGERTGGGKLHRQRPDTGPNAKSERFSRSIHGYDGRDREERPGAPGVGLARTAQLSWKRVQVRASLRRSHSGRGMASTAHMRA